MSEWSSRPLDSVYAAVFIDAVHVKIRDGQVANRPVELQIVFDTLFQRIPTLALAADVDDLPFKDDANIYGLYRLPVSW